MVNLSELLVACGRTLGLAIPLLPPPVRQQLSVAYLLARIADAFEDADAWALTSRFEALNDLDAIVSSPTQARSDRLAEACALAPPVRHDGYLEVITALPTVLAALEALDPLARNVVKHHTQKRIRGMADFVARAATDEALRLASLEDLQAYCYVEAGTLAELITELFVMHQPALEASAPYLLLRAPAFGEALELVHLLQNEGDDLARKRFLLPPRVRRGQLFSLARSGLRTGSEFALELQQTGAARGVVGFCAFPLLLAHATLDRVEEEGPGASVSSELIGEMFGQLRRSVAEEAAAEAEHQPTSG